ncbi:MAG: DUF2442 domain-containing protein [Planctomycetota bacterium]
MSRSVLPQVEVTCISAHGIWLFVKETEYLLPFDEYPWFRDAKMADIMAVRLLHGHHLRWDALDVDLELESLADPDQYPLIYTN